MITENSQKWTSIIKEELGIQDSKKVNWMSQYAQNHEIYEGLQSGSVDGGIYATPLNTLGMGNPMMPTGVGFDKGGMGIGNTGADFHNPAYQHGSGDIPMSTRTMALEVADNRSRTRSSNSISRSLGNAFLHGLPIRWW